MTRSALPGLLALVLSAAPGVGCPAPGAGPDRVPPLPARATEQTCLPDAASLIAFPPTLSATGCFLGGSALSPGPDLVPYYVRSPLWTDGVEKQRYLVLPPGAAIAGEEDWSWPVGTVLLKNFLLEPGEPVETRIMVFADSGWRFASYRWDGEGAALTDGGFTETLIDELPYQFPSEEGCRSCHTGGELGPVPEQLNSVYRYGDETSNQLDALARLGLFEQAPVADELPALPLPEGDAPLAERARSWLHANCAHCHRPGGWTPPEMDMDLRWTTPLADSRVCGVPVQWELAPEAGAWRIVPGEPDESAIWGRIQAADLNRMPPLGTLQLDPVAEATVRRWIEQLESCPE